jgi:hypothetical protein
MTAMDGGNTGNAGAVSGEGRCPGIEYKTFIYSLDSGFRRNDDRGNNVLIQGFSSRFLKDSLQRQIPSFRRKPESSVFNELPGCRLSLA